MNHFFNLRRLFSGSLAAFVLLIFAVPAFAHDTGESYIWLNPREDKFDGRIEFRLPDLREHFEFGADVPEDYESAVPAVAALQDELEAYVRKNFSFTTLDGTEIPYKITGTGVWKAKRLGHFAQLFFETEVMDEVPSEIIVKNSFLFEFNKYSRCLLCMEYNNFTGLSHKESFHHEVFSPWNTEQQVDFNNIVEVKRGRKYYLWEGMRHIWIGLDHILFLVTLLLASVLVKKRIDAPPSDSGDSADDGVADGDDDSDATLIKPVYEWVPVEGFRGAFWNIFKIVTIFTIAHSITLSLASLDIIGMNSQFVESIIALSIVLVAINNIIPTFRDRTWIILFLFGLFHGLGFASVMKDLPFRMKDLTQLLWCFNAGVEIGQMAIVAAVFPVIFLLRKSPMYKPVILVGGSLVMIAIAGYWFVERSMGWG
ncbi:MAG: HupE/UreJ family protein [Planctomycetota bacterium]